ncbi:ArsC family reductase [Gilvimarinus sp. F26214L]|uniref:ArsC family reductase n=1 Tax=Gilvimarinus sp. DZF01 TaxID=3461371 RepID=UPI004045C917
MITLYGISNCDTVKKARRWLESRDVEFRFHDFRTDGLSAPQVQEWIGDLGLDVLINKRSTTWKNLSEAERSAVDESSAVQLILDNPTLIKRPLLEKGQQRMVGFDQQRYTALFA